jgi:hypothetical protein
LRGVGLTNFATDHCSISWQFIIIGMKFFDA